MLPLPAALLKLHSSIQRNQPPFLNARTALFHPRLWFQLPPVRSGPLTQFDCIIYEMIELSIPGRGGLRLQHLVTDVNGTLAIDGVLMEGLAKRIASLQDRLTVHLLTADTHGRQVTIDKQLNLTARRLSAGNEQEQKRAYVEQLGADSVVAIGQGANDALMLKAAAVGICVMSEEGAATETMLAADIVVPSVVTAFNLLDRPLRLVATLRK